MGTDQVNAVVREVGKITGIPDLHLRFIYCQPRLCSHMLRRRKSKVFQRYPYSARVNIPGDAATAQQFGFYSGGTPTHKIIQHYIARPGILQNYIAGDVRRPISSITSVMRSPVAALLKTPYRGSLLTK